MNPMQYCRRCLAALVLWLGLHAAAHAELVLCSMTPPLNTSCSPGCQDIAIWPLFLLPPKAQAPNGTVLASKTVHYQYNCPKASTPRTYTPQYAPVWVNSTAVPGVRVRNQAATLGVRIYVNGQLISNIPFNNTKTWYDRSWTAPCVPPCSGSVAITYELVKVSDVLYDNPQPGGNVIYCGPASSVCSFNFSNFDQFRFNDSANPLGDFAGPSPLAWVSRWSGTSQGRLMARTCTVNATPVNVPMPPVNAGVLSAAGTGGTGDTPFSIGLTCAAGARVYVTLTDLTDPANRSDLLNLTTASAARGVRLRILRAGNVPVNYGAPSIAPGNPGQWLVGSSAGLASIPLTVRYVATGAVQAGDVVGVAAFTLSYQ